MGAHSIVGPEALRGAQVRAGLQPGLRPMQSCLYALCSVVMALGGVLLVAVPRFFLLPPVPVGSVAHHRHRLPPHPVGQAKADTGRRSHHGELFEAGGDKAF
jgi:hypothetical protein